MKRRLSAIALVLVMILSAVSASCAGVEDLKWGMSRDEVTGIMGTPDKEDLETSPGNVTLSYNNQPVCGLTASMQCVFKDDALFCRHYVLLDSADKARFKQICKELEAQYGPTAFDPQPLLGFMVSVINKEFTEQDIMDTLDKDDPIFMTWTPSEDMSVGVVFMDAGVMSMTMLFYSQPQ